METSSRRVSPAGRSQTYFRSAVKTGLLLTGRQYRPRSYGPDYTRTFCPGIFYVSRNLNRRRPYMDLICSEAIPEGEPQFQRASSRIIVHSTSREINISSNSIKSSGPEGRQFSIRSQDPLRARLVAEAFATNFNSNEPMRNLPSTGAFAIASDYLGANRDTILTVISNEPCAQLLSRIPYRVLLSRYRQ